jgi:hypothetical protein
MPDIETNQTPAADINKMPWFLTTRPTTSFLVMASLATGAYIALYSPAATSAPAVAAPAPAVKKCHATPAEKPVAKCVKIEGLKR